MKSLFKDVEQSVQVQVSEGSREPADLLFLCSCCDPHIILPRRDPRDAEVQQRGGHDQDWSDESPGRADADAHETVQSSEELLHCWVKTKNILIINSSRILITHEHNFFLTFHHLFLRFALFLCLVIKRLVGLISANAGLQVTIISKCF